jgi:hypothetical protein
MNRAYKKSIHLPAHSKVTQWVRVLETMAVTQLLKMLSTFYGAHKFIARFYKSRHWIIYPGKVIQYTPYIFKAHFKNVLLLR